MRLPSEDLFNLRLTCVDLDAKSFHHFTETYFKAKQFMYSRYALDALVKMSKSRLGHYVRVLALGPQFSQHGFYEKGIAKKVEDKTLRWVNEYEEENRDMEHNGLDNLMLHEALQNMPNCEEIEFRDYSLMDYGMDSFGEASVNKNVGQAFVDLRQPNSFHSLPRAFTLTLNAAQAARLRIKSVTVQVTHVYEYSQSAFEFPRPQNELDTFTFIHLRVLKIPIDNNYPQTTEGNLLRRYTDFLAYTPQLRLLGLTFLSCWDTADILDGLISASLRNLAELEVAFMDISEDELLEPILRLAPTLRSLRIASVSLQAGSWQSVFGQLRDHMCLTKIEIECVQHVSQFKYLGTDMETRYSEETEICYDGPNMTHFLNSLVSSIIGVDGNEGSLAGIDPCYFVI